MVFTWLFIKVTVIISSLSLHSLGETTQLSSAPSSGTPRQHGDTRRAFSCSTVFAATAPCTHTRAALEKRAAETAPQPAEKENTRPQNRRREASRREARAAARSICALLPSPVTCPNHRARKSDRVPRSTGAATAATSFRAVQVIKARGRRGHIALCRAPVCPSSLL